MSVAKTDPGLPGESQRLGVMALLSQHDGFFRELVDTGECLTEAIIELIMPSSQAEAEATAANLPLK